MRRLVLPLLLAFLTLGILIAIVQQVPSANGPAEWQWPYHPAGLHGLGLLIAAALMVAFTWWTAQDRTRDARWALPLLIALGWVLTLDVARAETGGFRGVMEALASRHIFGFVFDEGLAPDTRELLADYPKATADLNQHTRTHPPGTLLLVRGLDQIGRRLPAPQPGSNSLSALAAECLDREVQRAAVRHRPVPQPPPAAWTLVLLALLLPGLSALATWPLHRLALHLGLPASPALLAAALWILVPARSLFTPSLDQALPFLLLTAAALAAGPGRWRPVAAGVILSLSFFVTYGYLAPAVLVGLLVVVQPLGETTGESADRRQVWRRAALRAVLLAAGALLPWLVLAVCTGYNPLAAFEDAMAQHRMIAVESRSYATWLLWNPYDFALLLGPAVLGLAAAALVPRGMRTPAFRSLTWGWWALLALLLVSGTVRGEVGRIWLMLMPFACVLAAGAAAERWDRRSSWASIVLLLQAALLLGLAANMTFMG
ncbi:MAG TPA: hypothetical protein VH988_15155 [Thermoanaerobaculia bacterium]|jgi:hypothetical protein|nr:hypothetical protein [Thermoanaerobaculia bacterium]